MKRKVKRLLCGALAALLIFGGTLAEEGAPDAEAQAAIEAQQRAEQEAREQAEREARERAEREAREQAEREAKEKAEREAKEKAEREAKEKAEREAREKAEREAKEKAEREAKEKAEREAKEKAEREAKEKAEREAREKAEREAKEKAEREAKEKAEREAKEKAEAAPADKPKEDKPEEKPAVKEDKPEEKPSDVQEEKPVVNEDKPEEKPSDVQEEKPSAKEDQQEKAPEDKPDPVSEDQPKDAPEGPSEDTSMPEEASPESSEDTPTPAEESTESSEDTPTPVEESPESSEDLPIEASDEASPEDVPAVDEAPVESVEASDADASTQSRAEPPAGNAAKPEPVALPDALATEVASAPADIALVPEASKGVTGKDGIYQVAQAMPGKKAAKATLSFPLNYAGECTGYKVSVVDAQGNVVYTGAQTEPAVVLDLSTYKTGSYVLVVEAVSGDAVVAWGQYTFALASGSGFPGGFSGVFPGGFGGGFPGGGSGGAPDDTEQAAQGFKVTPGEALAGSHNAGTKDLQRYGTVSLTLSDEAMTELVLGGAALGIVLDGGREAFTAAIDGSRLTLTADGSGVWSFNGRALRILSDSGIETLVLENPAGAHDIATGSPLTGDIYARLCAEGVASSDYDYQVSGDGTRVSVDGRVYRVDDSGAMTPMEGDGYAEAMAGAAAGAA